MTDYEKQIDELIAAGERAQDDQWYVDGANDIKSVDGQHICSELDDGDAIFITKAANSREALKALRDERDRLREALEAIVAEVGDPYEIKPLQTIAQQALKGEE